MPILSIFGLLLCVTNIYSQNNKCDTTFSLKFDFVKYGRIWDDDLIYKFEKSGVLKFSKQKGPNEINHFYVDKKKQQRKLGLAESNKIAFTEVNDCVKYMLQHPKKRVKINLMEITPKGDLMLYYDVRWERKTSTQ